MHVFYNRSLFSVFLCLSVSLSLSLFIFLFIYSFFLYEQI